VLCSPRDHFGSFGAECRYGWPGERYFRPLNNQPFVQYPFVGGCGGNIRSDPWSDRKEILVSQALVPYSVRRFALPIAARSAVLMCFRERFYGGSILPGIVLNTQVLPATALTLRLRSDHVYGCADLLPDAPFVNRLFGESSWNNFVVGRRFA